ncbi:MAG: ArnT family glycosyltransferase [Candidatus Scalinduaceae bacterium]
MMKKKNTLGFIPLSLRECPIWIILIILFGFAARVLWWAYAEPVPVSDSEEYLRLAEGLLKQGQLGIPNPSAFRLPGYPVFLAITMWISNSIAWLSFVNVILSTFLIYIVWRLVLYLTSEKLLSILAALICAFNPTFVFLSPVLVSEHLYVIFLFSAFLVLCDNRVNLSTRRTVRLVLSGVLFGTAALTRGEAIFFLPVLLVMIYFNFSHNAHRYLSVFLVLLAFGVTIAPWYIRNHYLVGAGSGLSTTGGINFYYAHNENRYGWHTLKGTVFDGKNEVQQQELGYQLGLEYLTNASLLRIAKDIAKGTYKLFFTSDTYSVAWSTRLPRLEQGTPWPSKELKGTYWFYKLTLTYFALFLAASLSFLFLCRYTFRMWVFLYGIVMMNWIGYALIFWGKTRYRYVSEVVFCILAALLIFEIIKYLLYHSQNLLCYRKLDKRKGSSLLMA